MARYRGPVGKVTSFRLWNYREGERALEKRPNARNAWVQIRNKKKLRLCVASKSESRLPRNVESSVAPSIAFARESDETGAFLCVARTSSGQRCLPHGLAKTRQQARQLRTMVITVNGKVLDISTPCSSGEKAGQKTIAAIVLTSKELLEGGQPNRRVSAWLRFDAAALPVVLAGLAVKDAEPASTSSSSSSAITSQRNPSAVVY